MRYRIMKSQRAVSVCENVIRCTLIELTENYSTSAWNSYICDKPIYYWKW